MRPGKEGFFMRYANEFEDPDFAVEELVRNGVATRLSDFLRRFELEDCVESGSDEYMEIDY